MCPTFRCEAEDLATVIGCTEPTHKGCKGHHMMDPNRRVYMIPYGFAMGKELS